MSDQPIHTDGPVQPDEVQHGILRPSLKRVAIALIVVAGFILLIFIITNAFDSPPEEDVESLPEIAPSTPPPEATPVTPVSENTDFSSNSLFGPAPNPEPVDAPTFIEPARPERDTSFLDPPAMLQANSSIAPLPSDRYAERESKLIDALHASPVVALDESIYPDPDESTKNDGATGGDIPAADTYQLARGSVLPAVLLVGVTTDLPGIAVAHVSHDVYDSQTGSVLLIPRGSRLSGTYSQNLAIADRRVTISWDEIALPNGTSHELSNVVGADTSGHSGLEDRVNHRIGRAVAVTTINAAVTAALAQALDRTRPDPVPTTTTTTTGVGGIDDDGVTDSESAGVVIVGTNQQPSASQAAAERIVGQYDDLTRDITRRFMPNRPSLTIRPGFEFAVLLGETLHLPAYTL